MRFLRRFGPFTLISAIIANEYLALGPKVGRITRPSTNELSEQTTMSRVCQVTGKRPASGNNVSHAHNKTRRRYLPNLHTHRFWVDSEQRFVRLKVSAKGLRIIDKLGIEEVLTNLRARGEKV